MLAERRIGILAVGGLVALLALSNLGLLAEPLTAGLIAAVVAAVLAVVLHTEGSSGRPNAWRRRGVVLLAAASAAVVVVPVITSLLPGSALAQAELEPGDHLRIPDDAAGPARVLVHADIAGSGSAAVDYKLEGLTEPLAGHLERVMGSGRLGRRRVRAANLRDTEVRSVELAGREDVVLRSLRGATKGPLEVKIFRERWPLGRELALGVMVVVATAVLSRRRDLSPAVLPATVAAVTFGVLASRWLTPTTPLRSELGALVVALGAGVGSYLPWRWLAERRRVRS